MMWFARSDSNVCMQLIHCKESLSREYCALRTSSIMYKIGVGKYGFKLLMCRMEMETEYL